VTLTKRRLLLLEDNPTVRYRQELARLRRQEAVPFEEIVQHLLKTPEDDAFLAQLTHVQSLAVLRLYDNTDAQIAELDRMEPLLFTLEEQARYNVEKEAGR
jgi:hypothetical protein